MIAFNSLAAIATLALAADALQGPFKHKAVDLKVRQAMATPASVPASTTSMPPGVITIITPSPGASPVTVTEQSQIVVTYDPQYTLCELPPINFFPISPAPVAARPTTAPFRNYSISIPPGNGTCTTVYSQTQTMICDTTLSGLVTTYHVTNCAQEITFSSNYGWRLVTPTPSSNATYPYPNGTNASAIATGSAALAMITAAPEIRNLTTYYMAPWQELTAATAPADVIKKICFVHTNGTEECVTEYQVWHTSLVASTATSTHSLNVSTTIHGPSAVVIWETYVANITEYETMFSMATTMETEYETEWTTTEKHTATVSTGPTVSLTLTVEETSETDDLSTSTTTIRTTSTIFKGTTTVTAATPPVTLPPIYM